MNCVVRIRSRIVPDYCHTLSIAVAVMLLFAGKDAAAQTALGFGLGPSPTSPGMDHDEDASVFAGLRRSDDSDLASAFSQPQADPDFVTVGFS